jgi:hypothetical protein
MRYLYVDSPPTLASGQINDNWTATYPAADIPVKNVIGDFDIGSSVTAGHTVLFGSAAGLDDLGRGYIRRVFDNTELLIGFSSQGTHDGELDIAVDDHFTILNEYRVWAKPQRFITQETEPFVITYKDHENPVT